MVNPALVDPATIRATAAEAWVRGYPILRNYRTLYAQALDDADPRYVGGFGVFRHHPQPLTPADTDIAAPDNDTRPSWAWLDLRTEPWVISVPAEDRYYVLALHELDTVHAGFVGSRATGRQAGDHLVVGPAWQGDVPPGITSVIRTATQLIGVVGHTHLVGNAPADVADLRAVQDRYRLRPLHEYAGTPAPTPAPDPVWPVWRDEVMDTIEFFAFLDFLLGFFPLPPHPAVPASPLLAAVPLPPSETDLRGRLTDLGIDGRGEFEPAALPLEVRAEIERGIADGRARLERATAEAAEAAELATSAGAFGTREQIGADHLGQAVGANLGLYGLPAEEVWRGAWTADSAGHRPPSASDRDYTIRFGPDGLPPARFFWSATLYALPDRLLVDNILDRYSIVDRTPGLVRDPDGGLTLYVQHKRPADAQHSANWLPAPDGPFSVVLRLYGPDRAVLDGRWQLPPLTPR
ncbi:DUF1254 domain-containing protein [Streptomyces kaniharaensis]|uniref:DUF1254 domain-containing protein n=1 Tax=Streptomyces kaniharaensis TaxID=212423 RepID=A0A6N7KT55_9ACTN|nr:DUF1254 domain-containing protein [Streptomyces kaniharaensis]MQS13517.1 DUF1254 domain-containing protein [Streptomyces kaniharaensis]